MRSQDGRDLAREEWIDYRDQGKDGSAVTVEVADPSKKEPTVSMGTKHTEHVKDLLQWWVNNK